MPHITSESPYRAIIVHSSPVPLHRLQFFELLEQRRPPEWTFEVLTDLQEIPEPATFPVARLPQAGTQRESRLKPLQKLLLAAKYDIIVSAQSGMDIRAFAPAIYRIAAKKWIWWGDPPPHTHAESKFRIGAAHRMLRTPSYFFAQSDEGRAQYLANEIPSSRIFAIPESIDTVTDRNLYLGMRLQRETLRKQFGVQNRKVLVYCGALDNSETVCFLLDCIKHLSGSDPNWHLFLIGSGSMEEYARQQAEQLGSVTLFNSSMDKFKTIPLLAASDFYMVAGNVQPSDMIAWCCDLPVVSSTNMQQGPVAERLNADNSILFPAGTSPETFAATLPESVERFDPSTRSKIFEALSQLGIDNMVSNFVEAMNCICESSRPRLQMDIE